MTQENIVNHSSIKPLKLSYRTIYFQLEAVSITPPQNKIQKFWLRTENGSEELVEVKREDTVEFRVRYKDRVDGALISLKQRNVQLTSDQDILMLKIGKESLLANVSLAKKLSPSLEKREKKTFSSIVLIDPFTKKYYYLRDVKDFSGGWVLGEDINTWPNIFHLLALPILFLVMFLGLNLWGASSRLLVSSVFPYADEGIAQVIPIITSFIFFVILVVSIYWLYFKPLRNDHAFKIEAHIYDLVKELLSSNNATSAKPLEMTAQ